jgi:hypothetical protein
VPRLPLEDFFAAVAAGMVETQEALDEQGRDSFEAFVDTGVPPTVLTVSRVRLSGPVGYGLRPKLGAGQTTRATVAASGDGTLSLSFAYLLSPQGGDDPEPAS